MERDSILLAVLAQVLLTLVMYLTLTVAKARALKAGRVNLERRALYDDAWPEDVIQINNNIRNQFELPVLFYVVALILWQGGRDGLLVPALAWLFVVSRVVHAYIHTGANYVPARRKVFIFGWLVVLVMAGVAGWEVLAS